ncbi:MAG TPA: GNAT family N-acetyltransferase [Oculatellaceae cyanobacterium]
MSIVWTYQSFDQLSTKELYEIIQLREKIFVVEQNCPYLDADGKDIKSMHLSGRTEEGALAAYLRVVPKGISYDEHSIGRVVVSDTMRGKGLGVAIMREALKKIAQTEGSVPIRISAQAHLAERYYGPLGFKQLGDVYEEDGIPHICMLHPGAAVVS